ncbi:hemagglutinin repeat-containing protein, partial [Thiothrix sp.]|uniref:hemagglutinin repeat-containing protein n=1 Tax=Thiothrix sp. TaxID=1032 RepID=UPI002580C9D4
MRTSILHRSLTFLLSLQLAVQPVLASFTSISSQWDTIRTVTGAGYEIKKTLIADVLNHDGVLGQMVAGGNVNIDSDTFNNLHANVSAGADIAITAASTLTNTAYGASQTLHEVHKTGCFTCHSGQLGYRETFGGLIEAKGDITLITGNYSSSVEATRNTSFNLPHLDEFHDVRAASLPTPRDFKVLLDVQSPIFSDAVRRQQVDANGNPLNLGNLGGAYHPFAVSPQSTLPYTNALETRFPYVNYGAFLSSAYLSARLKYSPEHEPRMNGDEWAGLRLLSNAVANLRPSDTIGQGQAANTRNGSTQLSGNNVRVYASGNISVTGGNTQAKQNLTLSANGDLDTQAAALSAGGNLLAAAGNNLTLATSTTASGGNTTLWAGNNLQLASTTQTSSGTRGDIKWTNSREVGNSISSSGNLTLVAGNDLGIRASTATAEGQLTASAGNDLNVEAGENYQSHEYHRSETKKSWGGLKKKTTTTDHFEEHLTHTASSLSGKGGVSLEAGNTTTLVGSDLKTDGNLAIATGGELAILAAEDKHVVQHDQKSKSSFLGINYGKSTSSTRSTQTQANGSVSEAMGDMATTSGGSSTFQASQFQAGGNITLKAGVDKDGNILDPNAKIYFATAQEYTAYREELYKTNGLWFVQSDQGKE